LLLDEPTSSLDSSSEQVVMEALERAAQGRTTLIIAHRLSTARLADRIVVLDRGRIVEEGSHLELLARNGKYARFYHLQMMTGADNAAPLLESDVAVDEADWLPPYRALYKTGSRPVVVDNTLPPPAYSSEDEPEFDDNRTAQNSEPPAAAESVNSEEDDGKAGNEPTGS
jgi:ABC-type multidrug transport system ATPase subunit